MNKTKQMLIEESKKGLIDIVDEYQISHKGNMQCRCISGARGHLIAKLESHLISSLSKMGEETINAVRIEKKKHKGILDDFSQYVQGFEQAVSQQEEKIKEYLKDSDEYNEIDILIQSAIQKELIKMERERFKKEILKYIWENRTANNKDTIFAKFKMKDFKDILTALEGGKE